MIKCYMKDNIYFIQKSFSIFGYGKLRRLIEPHEDVLMASIYENGIIKLTNKLPEEGKGRFTEPQHNYTKDFTYSQTIVEGKKILVVESSESLLTVNYSIHRLTIVGEKIELIEFKAAKLDKGQGTQQLKKSEYKIIVKYKRTHLQSIYNLLSTVTD